MEPNTFSKHPHSHASSPHQKALGSCSPLPSEPHHHPCLRHQSTAPADALICKSATGSLNRAACSQHNTPHGSLLRPGAAGSTSPSQTPSQRWALMERMHAEIKTTTPGVQEAAWAGGRAPLGALGSLKAQPEDRKDRPLVHRLLPQVSRSPRCSSHPRS